MSGVAAEEITYSAEHGLRADIHRAPGVDAPTVLYVHGGGFQRGSRCDDPGRLAALAALGVTVVSIDYRLAPEWRYPAPVDDVRRAADHLRANGPALGLSTATLGVIGASAGGYLAAAAALAPDAPFDAVSLWFATTDLVASTRRSPLEERIFPVSYERALLGDHAGAAEFRAASPARWNLEAAPPVLIVHGDDDRIVAPALGLALHDALARHGRESTFVRLAGAGHEDPAFDGGPVLGLVAGWLRTQLAGSPR